MRDRGTAFFESWRGGYAGSPRALSDARPPAAALRRVGAGDGRTPFPPDVTVVRRHTPAYFARLAAARVLVANDIVTRHLVKGPRVRYLQTWHGTPLKLIGLDERAHSYAGAAAHRKRMLRDVATWDYLLSPSVSCTAMFRSAFGFEGPIWETGYPRNDVLRGPRAEPLRRSVRAMLHIADDELVVLHAPTWRDDQQDA